jgi:hypothetical protein
MTLRDEKGRFVKGHNIPGPGRPSRDIETSFINVLTDVCSMDKWKKICNRAVNDAIKGDAKARDFVASYLIGKPRQVLELQSAETVLLAQVLDMFKAMNLSPSDVFTTMLMTDVDMIEGQVISDE